MREAPRRGAASSLLLTKRPFDYLQASANSYTETGSTPGAQQITLKYTKMKTFIIPFTSTVISFVWLYVFTFCIWFSVLMALAAGSLAYFAVKIEE